MRYYYLDAKNTPVGPVSLEEINQQIQKGVISADPLIVPEGGTQWLPLSKCAPQAVAPRVPQAPSPYGSIFGYQLGFSPTIIADICIERPFEWARSRYNVSNYERSHQFCVLAGHLLADLGMAIGLIAGLVFCIRSNVFIPLITNLLLIAIAAMGQYIAGQCMSASDKLIQNTPHRISSHGILKCISVQLNLLAVILIAVGVITMIMMFNSGVVVAAIGLFLIAFLMPALVCSTSALFGQHPELLNIQITPVAAGEEAVGILSFISKALLKCISRIYLIIALTGVILTVAEIFQKPSMPHHDAWASQYGGYESGFDQVMRFIFQSGSAGLIIVVIACLVPAIAYFGYLFWNLGLEVVRSILILPGKVESIQKDKQHS